MSAGDAVAALIILLAIGDWIIATVQYRDAHREAVMAEPAMRFSIAVSVGLSVLATIAAVLAGSYFLHFLPPGAGFVLLAVIVIGISARQYAWLALRLGGKFR